MPPSRRSQRKNALPRTQRASHSTAGASKVRSSKSAPERRALVSAALKRHGSIRAAADALGLPKSTLFDLARTLGLSTTQSQSSARNSARKQARRS
jgi:transcriptional regulator with GAF, ATPase, and Fis domain